MPILNYTTKIPLERTISEITALLVKKGAKSISQDFDTNRRLVALTFVLAVGQYPVRFLLPVNVGGVAKLLPARKRGYEQAERVAWRILKDWVEAQIALIESGQAEAPQIFMPYAQQPDGRTMYQVFVEQNQARLTAGGVN